MKRPLHLALGLLLVTAAAAGAEGFYLRRGGVPGIKPSATAPYFLASPTLPDPLTAGLVMTPLSWTADDDEGGALSFSATGDLPPGLTLSPAGQLSGTPTTPGSYSFDIVVTDNTSRTATVPASANVAWPTSCQALKSLNPAAPDGTYTLDPDGNGGDAPISRVCDMTTSGGGWTLVASSWNNCYAIESQYQAQGKFITSGNTVPFTQARLACSRAAGPATFDNVLNYPSSRTNLATLDQFSSQSSLQAGWSLYVGNFSFPPAEYHWSCGTNCRWILRTDGDIHCNIDYSQGYSGCNLGRWARIWIR